MQETNSGDIQLVEKYFKSNYGLKSHHLENISDVFYMACIRTDTNIKELFDDISNEISFRLNEFITSKEGNIFEYINPKYIGVAKRLVNIVVGSNGGMASIGRGEWMICILSGYCRSKIIKKGNGDILYNNNICEELKWNGGKINVTDISGRDITKKFNNKKPPYLNDNTWVPFRKIDKKKYTIETIKLCNANYWWALTDEIKTPLDDNELKILMLERAFNNVFVKSQSILIVEEDGRFIRFTKTIEALEYYKKKISTVKLECRAKQNNPVAIYMHV